MVFLNLYEDEMSYLNDKARVKELDSHVSLVGDEVVFKSIVKIGDKEDFKLYGAFTNSEIQELFSTYSVLTSLDLTDANIVDALTIPTNSNCVIYTNKSYGLSKNEVINGICENFELVENYPVNIVKNVEAKNSKYIRNAYCDGGWESIILPYDVDVLPEKYVFDEYLCIDTVDDKQIIRFSRVTSLKANKAYLFRYIGEDASSTKRELVNFVSTNKKLITSPLKENFEGAYYKTSTTGKYILGLTTDGSVKFGLGGTYAFVAPFRAFLNKNTND